jgi:glutamyl-tRNA synthetase
MVKERVSFVREIWEETSYFFESPEKYDREAIKKRWKPETSSQLSEVMKVLEDVREFSSPETENAVKSLIEQKGWGTGTVMNALRLVIVGESRGPHIFDIISWIGREETLNRIEKGTGIIPEILE